MTTCFGNSCSFDLPCVSFVKVYQFVNVLLCLFFFFFFLGGGGGDVRFVFLIHC